MAKRIFCEKCFDQVTSQADLVTCMNFFKLTAFHSVCYADMQKSRSGLFVNTPVNSTAWMFSGVFSFIVITILCVLGHVWVFLPLALVGLSIRGLSWSLYERPLDAD